MPPPSANVEWTFLLSQCSPSPQPPGESLDWPHLLELADQHGVTALLHQSLQQTKADIPPEWRQALQSRAQTNLHKALLIAREQIRILDALREDKIEALPYKGIALAEALYGDLTLRNPGDIDLLIRPQDFQKIKTSVAVLGYTPHAPLTAAQERAYLRSGYECAFDSPAGPNLLEVQWALQPRFYAVDFEMEEIFRHAVTVEVAGRNMKTPSAEDLLLILSLHAAKHIWGRLIWLCDIARLMQRPELDWPQVAQRAKELGITRILHVTLALANLLLQIPIPPEAENDVAHDREAVAITAELAPTLHAASSFHTESLAYFRLMLRLRERPSDRMRFVTRLAFTPGPGEWSAVHLPAPLFPLYRIVRITRLAFRLSRI